MGILLEEVGFDSLYRLCTNLKICTIYNPSCTKKMPKKNYLPIKTVRKEVEINEL